MHMVQNNRQVIRLTFIIIIAAAIFGWWYARTFWQIDPTLFLEDTSTTDESDWVDFVASVAEQMLQIFLGLASSES